LCILYGSHNKQRLLEQPQTALTGWSLQQRRNVFPVRYEINLYILFRRNSAIGGLNCFTTLLSLFLKGSDDDILCLVLLDSWTLSIMKYSEQNTNFRNIRRGIKFEKAKQY
jgi:hypothetical protein